MSLKTRFICSNCAAESPKWMGQCPTCSEWNTMQETVVATPSKSSKRPPTGRTGYAGNSSTRITTLKNVETREIPRIKTDIPEFDRVLGGGFAEGMTILLGGNPGAGKSTLLLQAANAIQQKGISVLYCTGEESLAQVKDRAVRLGLEADNLMVAALTDAEEIRAACEKVDARLLIVDSIQTTNFSSLDAAPGGVAQMRACTSFLNGMAKEMGMAIVMVGHITKDEGLAGPMLVKHIVDANFLLSSTEDARYRILRAEKNRFGPASEIGVFAMTGKGMRCVENPSAIFLSRSVRDAPGSVITALWEGSRPMLVEVQALLDPTTMSNPRRVSVGMDDKRIAMLTAILGHRGEVGVAGHDVYVNVAGGVEVRETSADLAILLAMNSALTGHPVGMDVLCFGEVGLSGEVRPCQNGTERLKEAAKLGMKHAIVPAANFPREGIPGIDVRPVLTVKQTIEAFEEMTQK